MFFQLQNSFAVTVEISKFCVNVLSWFHYNLAFVHV